MFSFHSFVFAVNYTFTNLTHLGNHHKESVPRPYKLSRLFHSCVCLSWPLCLIHCPAMPTLLNVFALSGAVRGNLVLTPEAEKNSLLQAAENIEDKRMLLSGAVFEEKPTSLLVVKKHQAEHHADESVFTKNLKDLLHQVWKRTTEDISCQERVTKPGCVARLHSLYSNAVDTLEAGANLKTKSDENTSKTADIRS